MSIGLIGRKVGMTQLFAEDGTMIPVSVVSVEPNTVTRVRTPERDGYAAVQLAFGEIRERAVNKPMQGHFAAHDAQPSRHIVEMRVEDTTGFTPGQEIRADVFAAGDKVDVVGVSKGQGFAGVMKRHGFGGLSSSHGTQRKHRSPGAIGACATPSRVFKGMRMAGHMGNERVTILNLDVVQADAERNLLLVRGAIPGPNGGLVMVRSAVKAPAGRKH